MKQLCRTCTLEGLDPLPFLRGPAGLAGEVVVPCLRHAGAHRVVLVGVGIVLAVLAVVEVAVQRRWGPVVDGEGVVVWGHGRMAGVVPVEVGGERGAVGWKIVAIAHRNGLRGTIHSLA